MSHFQVGSYLRPCDGEAVAGDAIVVKEIPGGVFLCLIDALGHGRDAAEVALLAIRFLKQNASTDVAGVLTALNEHLKATRGAAVCMAFADDADGSVACTGIGNSVIQHFGKHEETYRPADGIVGVRFRSPRVGRLRIDANDLLLMYSDGVTESFSKALPALLGQPVEVIARRIVLDHGRPYDDAACIAVRYQP